MHALAAFVAITASALVGLRVRGVVVAAEITMVVTMTMAAATLMLSEREALCRHGRETLKGHSERDGNSEQAQKPQTHGRIVLHGI
jgi:hypothetical protein